MGKVKNILGTKPSVIISVEPNTTVYAAIELMCEKNIGGLLILENDQLVGIFTERDYARKIILKGKSSKEAKIAEVMTRNPFTVSSDSSIEQCMEMMSDKNIRHLPVVDQGKLVGMISIGDVVKQIIQDQKGIIEHLESYMTH
ncbi:MAG: CBS domain-containing protein [Chryseolinea sp.]